MVSDRAAVGNGCHGKGEQGMEFSFQLYSARKAPDRSKLLHHLARLGFRRVEGYGDMYDDPEGLSRQLQADGLSMPSGHFSLQQLEQVDVAHQIAGIVGIRHLICPWLDKKERPGSRSGWRKFARHMDALGQSFREKGLSLSWHNHDFEFAALPDGTVPLRELLEHAPAIGWQFDVAWAVRAGQDPLAWISEFGHRITALHMKDIAPEGTQQREDGWADLGHGTMDWPAIWQKVRKGSPASLFVLEHDNPSDILRFARRSLATARSLCGANPGEQAPEAESRKP